MTNPTSPLPSGEASKVGLLSLNTVSEIARRALKHLISQEKPSIPPLYEKAFYKMALEMGENEIVDQLIASQPAGQAVVAMVEGVSTVITNLNHDFQHYQADLATHSIEIEDNFKSIRDMVEPETWRLVEKNLLGLCNSNGYMRKKLAIAEDRLQHQEQQVAQLQRKSRSDALTGALNRMAMEEDLVNEFARAKRYKRTFAVLMTDIDFFKKVNDTYGHAMGDEVLKTFVAIIAKSLRDVDLLYRYGGEEFVVVLPETDRAGAEIVAERLRQRIAAQILTNRRDPTIQLRITASFGLTAFAGADHSYQDILERADRALYQAKNSGRNRVEAIFN